MWYQNTEHIGQPRLLHSGSVCNIPQMKKFQIFCRVFVDSVFSMVSPLVFIFCQPGYKATPIIFMCGIYFVLLLCLSFLCVWFLSSNVSILRVRNKLMIDLNFKEEPCNKMRVLFLYTSLLHVLISDYLLFVVDIVDFVPWFTWITRLLIDGWIVVFYWGPSVYPSCGRQRDVVKTSVLFSILIILQGVHVNC